MARDYARHAGENRAVAQAVYEAELPRHTGDALPESEAGAVLSVADRLDLITGLAATVGLPTGSSDPFAVRRAVLGLLAVLRAYPALSAAGLTGAVARAAAAQPVEVPPAVRDAIADFVAKRFEQVLVEEGQPIDWVRAVLPRAADDPARADRLLFELSTLVGDETFEAVTAAIQRARRIVPAGTPAAYDLQVLTEPAERALHQAVTGVGGADLQHFTQSAAVVVDPVNRFFDEIFVMADDPAVRAARLGLLATVRDLGADLIDFGQLHR
jgi:glycyl-tRNA synthetase